MKRFIVLTIMAAGVVTAAMAESASAWERGMGRSAAPGTCWHEPYYHASWGMPLALIVPPTAERQVHWGQGVGNSRITPIWPQFGLGYPVAGPFGPAALSPTPPWPTDLDQFGVYYVRGPW
jgi:hypothetical protein